VIVRLEAVRRQTADIAGLSSGAGEITSKACPPRFLSGPDASANIGPAATSSMVVPYLGSVFAIRET